jgi:hypothetical protein
MFAITGPGVMALGCLLIAGVTFATAYVRKDARQMRALQRMHALTISAVQEGLRTKIIGRLRYGQEHLTAPLSGRRCACYRIIMSVIGNEGGGENDIGELDDVQGVDFWVEDGSGKALVRLMGPIQLLVVDDVHCWRGSSVLRKATPELEELLERRGVSRFFSRPVEYFEGLLKEGDKVAVFGVAHFETESEPSGAHAYREPAQHMVIVPSQEEGLIVTNEPSVLVKR